jgi:hypothetical protein
VIRTSSQVTGKNRGSSGQVKRNTGFNMIISAAA